MSKNQFWQLAPYLLPVLSYVIGKSRNKLRVPKPVGKLIGDGQVLQVILQGVEAAQETKGKSDDEKREYVRAWARSELFKLLGEWLPDSTINFLIEHAIVRSKSA